METQYIIKLVPQEETTQDRKFVRDHATTTTHPMLAQTFPTAGDAFALIKQMGAVIGYAYEVHAYFGHAGK